MFDSQKLSLENFLLGYKHRPMEYIFLLPILAELVKTTNERLNG